MFLRAQTAAAKAVMKAFPRYGRIDDLHLQEVFNHDIYTQATAERQYEIQIESAQFTYDYEKYAISTFDHYFPFIDTAALRGGTALDLGSFSGGRMVYWAERYGFRDARGIDVETVYAEAGNRFAATKGVNAQFTTGFGEHLPYDSNVFDVIVSLDVFEHVQDVTKVVAEAWRVLKPGGRLLTVFPPYFNPLEAHLALATRALALHWFFSGRALTAAYYDILAERGESARWYARADREPRAWERSPFLNGITCAKFRQIVRDHGRWNMIHWDVNSLVSHGRRSKLEPFRTLARVLKIPAGLPVLEELFLGRVVCALEKR